MSVQIKKDSTKSPFSPKSANLEQKKSPAPANKMMAAWLNKSASKKNDTKKTENSPKKIESKTKTKDENSEPQKPSKTKSISAKLSEAFEESAEELFEEQTLKKSSKSSAKVNEKVTAKTSAKVTEKNKKRKSNSPKLTEKVSKTKKIVIDEEKDDKPVEKKKANKYFAAYMRREGPKNPGSKPIPIGKPNCFKNLKFLVTGVLDSMDRDDCKKIVEKYGGSCISGVTKKLDYLVVGEDAGLSKIDKAKQLDINMVNEDEFLKLICDKSGIKNPEYESENVEMIPDSDEELNESLGFLEKNEKSKIKMEKSEELSESMDFLEKPKKESKIKKEKSELSESMDFLDSPEKESEIKKEKVEELSESLDFLEKPRPKESIKPKSLETKSPTKSLIKTESTDVSVSSTKSEVSIKKMDEPVVTPKADIKDPSDNISQLWVDKYKPTKMTRIIGQTGDKSNATKLCNWLKNWQKNHGHNSKSVKKGWNDQDTGSCFKCALLSGPPGIGKTTTATIVAKEAGYTFIEFNASDSRSKKLLDKVLGESSDSCSIDSYFKGGKHSAKDVSSDKHCIIMDEVDGMAGNEDRGGILELINTIKRSKIPIICICNDRQHVKIRSLANHCFDLRFYKPRIEQVRAALMSVCFKENIKITAELLDQIIAGCNYDIRQCLHNLSMWSSTKKTMSSNADTKSDIERAMKDTKMNPFEACKQIFLKDPAKPKSIIDKMEYFFCDYSLIPLLVQENYLSVRPTDTCQGATRSIRDYKHLKRVADSSESICNADYIGRLIRSNNNWSLLPTQAVFATIVPGDYCQGSMGLPAFPGWFGKNSKQGRVDRILQELQKHMRMHISANKIGVGLDYLSVLKNMLSKPLITQGVEGIPKVIEVMNEYSLTRDDFDTILELSTWPGCKDPMTMIDSKVKAAFTRTFNKQAKPNPFTTVDVKKIKASKITEEGIDGEDADAVESSEDEKADDITKDSMIKMKTKSKTAAKTSKATAVKRGAKAGDEDTKPSASKKKKI